MVKRVSRSRKCGRLEAKDLKRRLKKGRGSGVKCSREVREDETRKRSLDGTMPGH